MLTKSILLNHYKREDIQREIIENAKNREIAIKFGDKGFGKRPDILAYPKDILELAKKGATSFHASEELWKNPLQLSPMMKRKDLENLRIGWDLVLDIDCKVLDYSKITTHLLVRAIRSYGINSVSCKFSGGTGFHIGIPFESFPKTIHKKETRLWFPDGARAIAFYLKERIKERLSSELLKNYSITEIKKQTGKKFEEIVQDGKFDPFSFVGIDTILISSRHLYRMPYSFNEKTGLVSVPINPNRALSFVKEIAIPKNVKVSKFVFLDKRKSKDNEARELLIQAFDFYLKQEERKTEDNTYDIPPEAIPEKFFPPCIKKILAGLEDGRKRSLFILVNFLTSVGWSYDQIEPFLEKWNKRNKEPLRDVLIKGQIRYHKQKSKKILPPNCNNPLYYRDFRVCFPDNLCKKIKNPVNYSRAKTRYLKK